MTQTTLADAAPDSTRPAASRSWLETAVAILNANPGPLTAHQIVTLAMAAGYLPRSTTKTPTQTVNRDLHSSLRRGDVRFMIGPQAGQFQGTAATTGADPTPAPTPRRRAATAPRLPIQPLVKFVDARGGLRACGVWDHTGDANHVRWARRLLRAYSRSRRRGWISPHTADEISVKALAMHPAEVWGADWWDA